MEERERNSRAGMQEHRCEEHVAYDGGRKINRGGVRIWIETCCCRMCGATVDIKEEILD